MTQLPSLNFIAHLSGYGGYQVMSELVMRALMEGYVQEGQRDHVSLRMIGGGEPSNPLLQSWLKASRQSPTGPYPISLSIRALDSVLWFYGKKRILYPATECSFIHKHVVEEINGSLDQLWATSTYAQSVYESNGVEPERIKYIPLYADTERFYPLIESGGHALTRKAEQGDWEPTPEDPIKFLMVGKFENRKASLVALSAWLSFFEEHPLRDCVQLLCKFSTTVRARTEREILHEAMGVLSRYPAAARRVQQVKGGDTDMLALYNECDCLLMPSRSEGVGLPVYEAMACGLPCIITPYSSFADIMDEDAHIILPYKGMEDARDPFYSITPDNFGQWGVVEEADVKQAIATYLDKSPSERLAMGIAGREMAYAQMSKETWYKDAMSHIEALV